MKSYEKYINEGLLKSIEEHLVKEGKVAKEYKGYISSLGASIIQSGLIPTLAFYSEQGGADENRSALLQVIQEALTVHDKTIDKSLFNEALNRKGNPTEIRRLQRDILNVSIALKLALRTFKMTGK